MVVFLSVPPRGSGSKCLFTPDLSGMMHSETMSFLEIAMVPCHQSLCLSTIIFGDIIIRVQDTCYLHCGPPTTDVRILLTTLLCSKAGGGGGGGAGNVLSWWIEDTQVLSEDLSPKQFH